MTDWNERTAPGLADIAALARAAFDRMAEPFRRAAGEVEFHVEEFADEETLKALGIEDPFELSGLYRGVDLLRRSFNDPEPRPSQVLLYRRPILDEWSERDDLSLGELVTHILVHEIAHHFGFSDDDIHRIEEDG